MSLTRHLKDPSSPVRQYLVHRFPLADTTRQDSSLRKELQRISSAPHRESPVPSHERQMIGTAFDYRIRYYFAITPLRQLVAVRGMAMLNRTHGVLVDDGHVVLAPTGSGPLPKQVARASDLVHDFLTSLKETLARLNPLGRQLDHDEEEELARYCLVLALFEHVYRVGVQINSPLYSLGSKATLVDLLALAKPEWVADLRMLSWDFYKDMRGLCDQPAVLNPTFEGSKDVGGADADLIVTDCLFEIKTVSKLSPSDFRDWLYQLLGYLLLDYSDRYGIRRIGLLLTRHRQAWTSPISVFISGSPPAQPLSNAEVIHAAD